MSDKVTCMLVASDYEHNMKCSLFCAVVSEFYINLEYFGILQ